MQSLEVFPETTIVHYGALIGVVVLLVTLAAFCLLQTFLSKQESRWPGLILPLLSLFPCLFNTLSLSHLFSGPLPLALLGGFLLAALPLALFLLIYIRYRKKLARKREIAAMQIQDLEEL